MNVVYLLTGSNLGDRMFYLEAARQLIAMKVGVVENESAVYQTASWGKTDQPDYYNQVLQVKTSLTAYNVLSEVLQIEKTLGRERSEKWGSRTIDIDILFFNSEIIESKELTVPHPQLHNRRFTLQPLNEIAPLFNHPVFHKTIRELLLSLEDNLSVQQIN